MTGWLVLPSARTATIEAGSGLELGATPEEVAVSPSDAAGPTWSAAVFEALPFAAFVVDDDVRVLAANAAANRLVGEGALAERHPRGGEALHCVNSGNGCGKSAACRDCVLRNAVTFAVSGGQPVRRRTRIEYHRDGSVQVMQALVTASPLGGGPTPRALLCIEDLALMFALTDALPVCMGCRKVMDADLWMQIEAYLDAHFDLKFSHGLCPECARRLYPEELGDVLDSRRQG